MLAIILAAKTILPETLRFLNVGWWILHVMAITLVGLIGFSIGKCRGIKFAQKHEHEHHEDAEHHHGMPGGAGVAGT